MRPMVLDNIATSQPEKLAALSKRRMEWVRVGQLIDGETAEAHRDADVLFNAWQIVFVGTNGQTPPRELLAEGVSGPDAVLPGHTLLPCLIESHAHLFLDGAPVNLEQRERYLKESPA